jgi:DNA-binding PadR family transcriptional regulator
MESPVTARAALLQALARGENFGLALIDLVRELTGGAVLLKQGSVYPQLAAMEAEGLVQFTREEPQRGRARRWYALTPEGYAEVKVQRAILRALITQATRTVGGRL